MSEFATRALGEIASCRMGETILSRDLNSTGYPIYSADSSTRPWGYKNELHKVLERGSIVIGARGTIGKPRLPNHDKFGCTQTTIAIIPGEDVNPFYLKSVLETSNITKIAAQQAVPMLTVGDINQLSIPLPPLPEQKKIAEILSGIDRTIARYLQKEKKLSKLRSALRSDLLSGRKGSWGMSDMQWLSGTLQDIARPANDKWIPSQNENSIPYIGLEHILPENPKVADHGKSSEVISTKNKFKKGDTLFGKLRPYLQKVAFADFTGICSTDIIPIRASAETDPAFLYYLISSPKVIAKAIESSAGNVMPRASWQDIRGIEIAIPPLPEQKKIAEILSGVDHQMATLLDAEKKYVSLKQAIAADLLSGRKRVSV